MADDCRYFGSDQIVRGGYRLLAVAVAVGGNYLNPRAEDVRSAEASVASAQAALNALLAPRAEDVASA